MSTPTTPQHKSALFTRSPMSSTKESGEHSPSDLEKPSGPGRAAADGASQDGEHEFPDGGLRAWLVAAGASSVFFCTLGNTNCWGVYQAFYSYHQLPDRSEDDIAWIGSIQAFLIFAMGAVGGPLFDRFGAWIIRPAAILYVFAIMMTSLCGEYWQFMLAQGILTGVAIGLLMFPAFAAVPQWFDKKRGAAMGVAVAGSSLGAVIFPILLSKLLTSTSVGFGWSVRVNGFVMIPVLAFACVAIKARLPPRKTRFFLPESFKNTMYVLLILAVAFTLIGMFVPQFLLPLFAIQNGMNETLAGYLVAIINAASIFGRVIPGFLGDKFGRMNTFIFAGASTAIIAFAWPFATSNAGVIVLAVFFGFCSGAIISGSSVAFTLAVNDTKNTGTYIGVGMALASFSALVGPPVSGAMIDKYGGFHEVSYFSGALTLTGTLIAVIAKSKTKLGLFGRT